MEILAVENVTFSYPSAHRFAVQDVSFSVSAGEFVVLCGATGSGKSTLLRLFKPEIAPLGEKTGGIYLHGEVLQEKKSEKIGFVMQRPDEQIVTDKVYAELAFALENAALPQNTIARRIAEIASYFGIEDWFDRDVSTLSGGQKQLLNLASVMVSDPEILILDEPTSQLDPIATADFVATLKKLSTDFSLTVLVAEHALEEWIPICDRVLVMENGKLMHNADARQVLAHMTPEHALFPAMPIAARLFHRLEQKGVCPLTVREGRALLTERYGDGCRTLPLSSYCHSEQKALEFKNVSFRYERSMPDILKHLSLTVYEKEIFCILGGNGSGKTTALSCAAHLLSIYSGEILVFGKNIKKYQGQSLYQNGLTMLPQDVETLFLRDSVEEELKDSRVDVHDLPFDLTPLLHLHPYDLSGGEAQLLALAKVLATKPRLLLLDEPTKGIDAAKKLALAQIFRRLKQEGMTILIVTHDVEFAAACADRAALFFRGEVVSASDVRSFFAKNRFYTTAASRMTTGIFENTVTLDDIVTLCRSTGTGEAP